MLEILIALFLAGGIAVVAIINRKQPPSFTETPEPLTGSRTPRKASPQCRTSLPTYDVSGTAQSVTAKELKGAAYVIDGDSIRIKGTEIRLFGVDAPEFSHPYGKKAKWELVRLCKGQPIFAEVVATDDHGRTVAKCSLPDGRDLSAEMVKAGLALDWPKFSGGQYRCLEPADARRKLWLADARQKGRMHVWEKFEAQQKARRET